MFPVAHRESFSGEDTSMMETNSNVIAVVWRVLIAACVVMGRLALDRFAVRGQLRRSGPHGH
jgi:hypothetical protein